MPLLTKIENFQMSQGFNYSKWDRLEVSDDEKDAHPNIDSSLMIRIKREQRARREAEEQMKISQLRKVGTPEALKQIAEIEKKSKLHVDNICRVVDEKSMVNRSTAPPLSAVSSGHSDPEDDSSAFEDFVEKHEETVIEYASLKSFEQSEKYLLDHLEILNEHACGWMLLHQLNLEMGGMRNAMLNATRQYLILRNVIDLATEAKRSNDARPLVQLFFKQVNGDPERKKLLETETLNFAQQIINRAIQKKTEESQ